MAASEENFDKFRENLLQGLKASIEETRNASIHTAERLKSTSEIALTLVQYVEKLFFWGFNGDFWEFIEDHLIEDDQYSEDHESIEYSGALYTEHGKARAFLRLTLNRNGVKDLCALIQRDFVNSYQPWSLMRSKPKVILEALTHLTLVNFNLDAEDDALDEQVWLLDNKRILHLVNTSEMDKFMAEHFASSPAEPQAPEPAPAATAPAEQIQEDSEDDDFYMFDHYAQDDDDDDGSEPDSPEPPPSEEVITPVPIAQPTPPSTSPDIIKTIGKSTQKTLAKLGFGEFPGPQKKEPLPTKIKKMQTVGDVLIHEERSLGTPHYLDIDTPDPMEKYNTAPPIHLAGKQFSVSADELNWTTWQENDDISKLPSLAIQYYEDVRNDQNVKFQGILHKKGQNNKEWKVRIFSMNPDTGFYIRYFTEDSKLEVGYERGSIDVEDIINIETGRADKAGFILISLRTTNRTFHLSTQSSKMAGTFVGVVCNMKEIITTQISKKIAEDMYRHRDKVLIKGWMQKMGKVHRTWKRRFFVLDTNRDYSIRYWEKEDTTTTPKGVINLVNVNFVQNTQNDSVLKMNPYSFDCITDERTFHIAAESAEQRDQWVSVLGEVIGQDQSPEIRPIHKGIVQRHGESQRRNIVNKAWVGLSRRVQKAYSDSKGYFVLFPDKAVYFSSPKRFDLWARMQLLKGGSGAFEFDENEVEIPLLAATLHRVTGFGEGKDRFALIWDDTRYIFSCQVKGDTEKWMEQLSKHGDMNISVMPKY